MGDTSTGTFDMNSWQGLTKVLQAGRDANMNPETYAEFRDSVLRYAQSGGTDAELRARIEELLPGFEEMTPEVKEKPQQKKPEPVEKEGVQKQVAPPDNLPMEEPTPAEPKKEEAPIPEKKPVPPKPEPVEEKPAPAPMPPAGELMSADEARERIAEIKHAVTEYIGNPVTLVSENETVGRAYMQALLAAMKAVSGNAPGTLRSSMQGLEEAYKQVLEIKVGQSKAQPIAEKPEEEKKPEPVAPPKPEPIEVKTAPAPMPLKPEPVEEKQRPIIEREHTISSLDERIQRAKEKAAASVQKEPPKPIEKKEVKEPEVKKEEKKTEPPKPVQQQPSPKKRVFTEKEIEKDVEKAVQQAEQKKPFVTPDLEGTNNAVVPKGVTDDLFAPEIEEGIDQLLKEWSIFKGDKKLFGRGPAGREHPLFQQLRNTIMFDVIAGHFEGADKGVVLSIRDYANAWRNEQGIVYSPSETFEHYLRRVIRRIIKRSA